MATALKITEPISAPRADKHDTYLQAMIEAVRPHFNADATLDGDGEYYPRLRDAIVLAMQPAPNALSITEAIRMFRYLRAYANQKPTPFGDDSVEDHATYAGQEACLWWMANGTPRNIKEAQARASFVAAEMADDRDNIPEDLLIVAIKSMGRDMSPSSAKAEDDPALNPLREIAARLKFLYDNWEAMGDAAESGKIDEPLGDEVDALLNQASYFDAHTPADAMILLWSIYHGMETLIDDLDCESHSAPADRRRAFEWLISRTKSAHRATFLLANWIEATHGINRAEIAGDQCIPAQLSPLSETQEAAAS